MMLQTAKLKWNVQTTEAVEKELNKIDKKQALKIIEVFKKKVASLDKPTTFAKPLCYEYSGFHSLRVGNYRVVFYIIEKERTIQITRVRHRKDAYN